jgi:hypothetical protein
MMKDWKTTLAGIGALCTAAGVVIHMYSTGMWDAATLGQTLLGLLAGLGLVAAKDA